MQKIGIIFDCCPRLSAVERIHYMKKYGFETTFLMSDDPEIDVLVPLLSQNGITVENCHAPFRGINSIWMPTEEGEAMLRVLLSGVENCARNGIPALIVHLSSGDNPPRIGDVGCDRFDRLVAYARERSVQIVFENQRKLGNLAHAFEQYPDAGFCFDTGHEACFTPGREYMPLFGNRIAALHLHDNAAEYNADDHLIPYDGRVDLERCARQLATSPYDRSIMSESIKSSFYDHLTEEEFYARAEKAVRRFADRVAYYRGENA